MRPRPRSESSNQNQRRISLRDIAREAGVSHATVSMALRNHPHIATATRGKIKVLAEAMGYRPDPMLRALAEYRRDRSDARYQATLAWVNFYPDPKNLEVVRDFRDYRMGAEQRAEELGYKLAEITPSKDGLSSDKLRKILVARGIQGILLPPQPKWGVSLELDLSDFSAVSFGFSLRTPRLHTVTNHQFHSSMLALEKLREYGYRRIGLAINTDQDMRSERSFLGGYLAGREYLPKREHLLPLLLNDSSQDAVSRELMPWYERNKPDAVITGLSEVTVAFKQNGVRIPEDVSLAMLACGANNKLAGINQNSFQIGRVAVDLLAGMLHRNEKGVSDCPHLVFIEGAWQDGPSVRVKVQG